MATQGMRDTCSVRVRIDAFLRQVSVSQHVEHRVVYHIVVGEEVVNRQVTLSKNLERSGLGEFLQICVGHRKCTRNLSDCHVVQNIG